VLLATVPPHWVPPEVIIFGANRRDESVHAQHAAVLERINAPLTYCEVHDDREDGLEAAQVCQVGFEL